MRKTVALSLGGVGTLLLLAVTLAVYVRLPARHVSGPAASRTPRRRPALRLVVLPTLPPRLAKARIRPDEIGRIPILMYHAIGAPPARRSPRYDRQGLNISPATFRHQLQLMYQAGWYPVNMRDLLTDHLDVPMGRTPVVLTFDDARPTQFRYRADGTLDPDCAVGILEAFHAKHPSWPLRATFYVLPKSRWNPTPFGQAGQEKKKLDFLVARGFEVANHSTSHRLMCRMDGRTLQWEMAECVRYVREQAPAATMDTMALPGGGMPRRPGLCRFLLQGEEGGVRYRNRCVLRAWGGPAYAWGDRKFNPLRVPRIGAQPGFVERWISRMERGPMERYVSDGDPNTVMVPRSRRSQVNTRHLDGACLLLYGEGSSPDGTKRIVQKSADRKVFTPHAVNLRPPDSTQNFGVENSSR